MSHVLTDTGRTRAAIGTNAPIEQPFGAMMAGRRPRSPNVLCLDVALEAAHVGAYAGVDSTPHIDRLARSGVRFTAARGSHDRRNAVVPEVLREHGYDDGAFGFVPGADAAELFIGMRRSAPWAAYVDLRTAARQADLTVGRLVQALRRTGAHRRTVVALTGVAARGGVPVPAVLSWPGQVPPRQRHDGPVYVADLAPTLVETACPGAAADLDGVDLTAHLFDGTPMPGRPVAVTRPSAA